MGVRRAVCGVAVMTSAVIVCVVVTGVVGALSDDDVDNSVFCAVAARDLCGDAGAPASAARRSREDAVAAVEAVGADAGVAGAGVDALAAAAAWLAALRRGESVTLRVANLGECGELAAGRQSASSCSSTEWKAERRLARDNAACERLSGLERTGVGAAISPLLSLVVVVLTA